MEKHINSCLTPMEHNKMQEFIRAHRFMWIRKLSTTVKIELIEYTEVCVFKNILGAFPV